MADMNGKNQEYGQRQPDNRPDSDWNQHSEGRRSAGRRDDSPDDVAVRSLPQRRAASTRRGRIADRSAGDREDVRGRSEQRSNRIEKDEPKHVS